MQVVKFGIVQGRYSISTSKLWSEMEIDGILAGKSRNWG
jgi:hypothetical protein